MATVFTFTATERAPYDKPLVPTRNGEAFLLAAHSRRSGWRHVGRHCLRW